MASRVWVFDNAISSRSCLIDHKPSRLIVLAMMLSAGAFNRVGGVRASAPLGDNLRIIDRRC